MTSNNETFYRQISRAGNIARTMTSNRKQFTVTREMLTAVARDQRWPDDIAGISARFSKFAFVLFCFAIMNGPLGNSELCFTRTDLSVPRDEVEGNIEILGKQNSLFLSGPAIKC